MIAALLGALTVAALPRLGAVEIVLLVAGIALTLAVLGFFVFVIARSRNDEES